MSAVLLNTVPRESRSPLWRAYLAEIKFEFLKVSRMPAYVIPTLAFPNLFYLMFGILLEGKQSPGAIGMATYLMASYGAFGVMAAALFGFAVGVSSERGYGWLQVKRASPMPPHAYLIAKLAMSMAFGAILVTMLMVLGATLGGVRLAPGPVLQLLAILVAGMLPFAAMGLWLGCRASPAAAPVIANAICLPMGFLSGVWLPLQFLPPAVQHVAPWLPLYHLSQLANRAVGAPSAGPAWQHVGALGACTLVFLALALRSFTRDETVTYG